MTNARIVSRDTLAQLCQQADQAQRLRVNMNLHPQLSDPVQRFCNAMQPGTYVRPHRHRGADRWELFVILQGEAGILLFDDSGTLKQRVVLEAAGANRVIEIPAGQWHSLYTVRADTVLFETKPGPYQQASDKDFATWAPAEGEPGVERFLQWYASAQPGDSVPEID